MCLIILELYINASSLNDGELDERIVVWEPVVRGSETEGEECQSCSDKLMGIVRLNLFQAYMFAGEETREGGSVVDGEPWEFIANWSRLRLTEEDQHPAEWGYSRVEELGFCETTRSTR